METGPADPEIAPSNSRAVQTSATARALAIVLESVTAPGVETVPVAETGGTAIAPVVGTSTSEVGTTSRSIATSKTASTGRRTGDIGDTTPGGIDRLITPGMADRGAGDGHVLPTTDRRPSLDTTIQDARSPGASLGGALAISFSIADTITTTIPTPFRQSTCSRPRA